MAGSPTKRARRAREKDLLADENVALEAILTWTAEGKHLTAFCKQHDLSYNVIYNWITATEERKQAYAHAREAGAETLAGEMLDTLQTNPERNHFGNVDPGHVTWLKNKADGLKWMASKLKPHVFGDKVDITTKTDPDDPLVKLLQTVQGTTLPINSGVTIDHDDID